MRIRSEVIALREIEPGTHVGYDGTFTASRATTIATVPIGYGDGLPRQLGNRGAMLVRGVRCPIVGRVSMDLTMLDVTHVEGALQGDEVVALGAQGRETITADEIATLSGTIAYDVLTAVSRRVPRTYVEE
jgi:alanine racemase